MRVKVLFRGAQFAWSPKKQEDLCLCAGTAAQQFDASFSTNASLDICPVNFSNSDDDELSILGSLPVQHRFQRLVWGGVDTSAYPKGLIIGGSENGIISVYDAGKLMVGDGDGGGSSATKAVVSVSQKHTGSVKALSLNPFQTKLLASGAGESEVFVWDLNNPGTPMSPGPKAQPYEQVTYVAWNNTVEHILGSTYPGRALIWDLRRNDGPIVKIGDAGHRVQWSGLSWHPEAPTSLCLSSEDDHYPYVQLWDLRYAQAPVLQMEGHQKGVLSISWCPHDPDLLISCGKDCRIYIWNPNTGEFQAELPYSSNHWPFEVSWCPKNPNLIGCASYEGSVSVYTLMARGKQFQPSLPSPKLAESFPGMDFSAQPRAAQHIAKEPEKPVILPKPPRWMVPPVGARFGFGGKLVSFHKKPVQDAQSDPNVAQQVPDQLLVSISQVVTEPALQESALAFQQVLGDGTTPAYCEEQMCAATEPHEKQIWKLLRASFDPDRHERLMEILGYGTEEIVNKVQEKSGINLAVLGLDESSGEDRSGEADYQPQQLGVDGVAADISGLSLKHGDSSELSSRTETPAIGMAEALQCPALALPKGSGSDMDSLLCQSLLSGQHEIALELLIKRQDWTNGVLLASAIDQDTVMRVQRRLLQQSKCVFTRLICTILYNQWETLIESVELDNWTELLVAVLTHAPNEDIPKLIGSLGKRMEEEGDGTMKRDALVCYICAGLDDLLAAGLEKVGTITAPSGASGSEGAKLESKGLQDIIEKSLILRSALATVNPRYAEPFGAKLSKQLASYGTILANQGCLQLALQYLLALPDDTDKALMDLRDRVFMACGSDVQGMIRPKVPYRVVNVLAQGSAAPTGHPSGYTGYRSRGASLSQGGALYGSGQTSGYGAMPPPQAVQPPHVAVSAYGSRPYGGGPPQSFQPAYAAPGLQPHGMPDPHALMHPHHPAPGSFQQYSGSPVPPISAPHVPAAAPPPPPPTDGIAPQAHTVRAQQRSRYPSYSHDGLSYPTPIQASTPIQQVYPEPPAPGQIPQHSGFGGFGSQAPFGTAPVAALAVPSSGMGQSWQPPPPMPPSQAQPPIAPPPATARNPPVAAVAPQLVQRGEKAAWNDPPAVGIVKKDGAKADTPPPLTTPFAGAPEPEPAALMAAGMAPSQFIAHSAGPQQTIAGSGRIGTATPVQQEEELGPIPTEHVVLQQVFDRMLQLCNHQTASPQIHRKMDEISKKLNSGLYYMLKSGQLSENALQNLHQLIGHIQARDIQSALHMHAYMAQGPDFAILASFMPSVKVLLQTAAQLGVNYG